MKNPCTYPCKIRVWSNPLPLAEVTDENRLPKLSPWEHSRPTSLYQPNHHSAVSLECSVYLSSPCGPLALLFPNQPALQRLPHLLNLWTGAAEGCMTPSINWVWFTLLTRAGPEYGFWDACSHYPCRGVLECVTGFLNVSTFSFKETFQGSKSTMQNGWKHLWYKIDQVEQSWVGVPRFLLLVHKCPLRHCHRPPWPCSMWSTSPGAGQRPGLGPSFPPILWKFSGTLPVAPDLSYARLSFMPIPNNSVAFGPPTCSSSHQTRALWEWTGHPGLWCSLKLPASTPFPASLHCEVDCCCLLSLIQFSSLDST